MSRVRCQRRTLLLHSVRPYQDIWLWLHRCRGVLQLFNRMLVGLDTHSEHKCATVFCLHGWLRGRGEWCWHRGELVSSGCTLEGIGAASRATESWGLEDGWHEDLLLVAVDSFWHCLPGFPGVRFGLGFGKVRRFLLCVHLWLLLLSPSKLQL